MPIGQNKLERIDILGIVKNPYPLLTTSPQMDLDGSSEHMEQRGCVQLKYRLQLGVPRVPTDDPDVGQMEAIRRILNGRNEIEERRTAINM